MKLTVTTIKQKAGFMAGFLSKMASEEPFREWMELAKKEEEEVQKKEDKVKISPVEASQDYAPDTYYRYGP